MKNTEQYNQYLQLMRYKKLYFLIMPISGLVGVTIIEITKLPVYFGLIFFIIPTIWFIKKNICPWCGKDFFRLKSQNGLYFLVQKECTHCKQPHIPLKNKEI